VVTLDRTQEELALEIGAARESVSRALKQLRRTGLIQSAGGDQLIIPDVARLRDLLPSGDANGSLPP
jgi:CRP-like cAMP-binding protein